MTMKTHRPAALITGGARRIGQAIALGLAADGFDIAIHYRHSKKDAERTAALVRKAGVECEVFQADLFKEKAAIELIAKTTKRFSRLSVLVNSASLFKPSGLKTKDIGSLKEHWAIHVQAPWLLTAEFVRSARSGVVINVLDTAITKDKSSFGAYLLSKKALADLSRMQAVEFAPRVRVNAVAPGFILPPEGQGEAFLKKRLEVVPLKRQGSTDNVLQAVRFLVQNDYVTGQTIFVDGGEHLS